MVSSRQLRNCASCERRKNLAWDADQKLCHDCLIERKEELVLQYAQGKTPFHVAQCELMRRLKMTTLEAEEELHPPLSEERDGTIVAPLRRVKIGETFITWEEGSIPRQILERDAAKEEE